jgi:hypothetical protein
VRRGETEKEDLEIESLLRGEEEKKTKRKRRRWSYMNEKRRWDGLVHRDRQAGLW